MTDAEMEREARELFAHRVMTDWGNEDPTGKRREIFIGHLIQDITSLCRRVRDKALEEAANYEAERVKHFQACMDNEKTKNKYGYEHHQRVLWEYQAMRDEHIQSEKAIRALRAKGEKP